MKYGETAIVHTCSSHSYSRLMTTSFYFIVETWFSLKKAFEFNIYFKDSLQLIEIK